jgi:hypothetical protein
MDLGSVERVQGFSVLFADRPWPRIAVVSSPDGETWSDLLTAPNKPLPSRYVQVRMWAGPEERGAPAIRELYWRQDTGTP